MSRIAAFVRTARLLLAFQVLAAAGAAALAFWAATHVSRLADERAMLAARVAELEAVRPMPIELLPHDEPAPGVVQQPQPPQQPRPNQGGQPAVTRAPEARAPEPLPPAPDAVQQDPIPVQETTPAQSEQVQPVQQQQAQPERRPRLNPRDALPVIDRLLNRPRPTREPVQEDASSACIREMMANGLSADQARARCAVRQRP